MSFPPRRKPLALLLCCGFAGAFSGGLAAPVLAQGAQSPLHVDPVLLGLPPLPPVPPVELPQRPPVGAEGKSVARQEPLPAKAAPAAPATAAPTPAAPAPAVARAPARATPTATASSAPVAAAPRPSSGLAPLHVDPALLGVQPVIAGELPPDPAEIAAKGPRAAPPPALRASAKPENETDQSATQDEAGRQAVQGDGPVPVFLSAERMHGTSDRESVAEGAAQLRKAGTVLDADRLTYRPLEDEVEAEGNVRLTQGESRISGPHLRLKLEDQIGFVESPSYVFKRPPPSNPAAAAAGDDAEAEEAASASALGPRKRLSVPIDVLAMSGIRSSTRFVVPRVPPMRAAEEGHGSAERIEFEGENQIRIKSGTFSTCPAGNQDWYAAASELQLDYDREVGTGRDATIYFKDVPILYSPWMTFSLNGQRKSGLLAPTFGSTSRSGLELTVPYYWNIAPNMDATIAPRVLSKRGMQLNTEFRYLDKDYAGIARVELLPDDQQRKENRYGVSLLHTQSLADGLTGAINFNRVSDDHYYTDLSSRIGNTSQRHLLQQGLLTYGGGWWFATANVQGYQTLRPDDSKLEDPYRLLPQLTLIARQPELMGMETSFLGQYTSFAHKDLAKPEARRAVLYPQLAMPHVTPGWYVTPKLGLHATYYAFDRQAEGVPNTLSRSVPIVSVDSGMTFERSSNWFGRDYTQTLEPRLYYLYVPYRDQSRIPLFDSGLADFNFAQIFSENQFLGQDRISDANQLTAAVSSRLVDPTTGQERIRAMVGQRFYFSDQRVTLDPSQERREWAKSDILAAVSGQVLPKVHADAALQYGLEGGRIERYSIGARYVPEPGKVLNASYRFNRNPDSPIDQFDIAGQWPLFGGWHAVGRYNYSLKDRQPIENIAGLEYNGGCWVARVVGHRLATSTGVASTALFFQLELNGFSRIGSNPLQLLRRNIQGYGMVNQPTADPVFGQ